MATRRATEAPAAQRLSAPRHSQIQMLSNSSSANNKQTTLAAQRRFAEAPVHPRAVELRALAFKPVRAGYRAFVSLFERWETPRHLAACALEFNAEQFADDAAGGACTCLVEGCNKGFFMKNRFDFERCFAHVYSHLPAEPPCEDELRRLHALDRAVADSLAYYRAVEDSVSVIKSK